MYKRNDNKKYIKGTPAKVFNYSRCDASLNHDLIKKMYIRLNSLRYNYYKI